MRYIAVLFALVWAAQAHAQPTCAAPPAGGAAIPWNTAVLTWVAPTQNTDGSAILAATPKVYKIYGAGAALCQTTALTAALPGLAAGANQCWTATATVAVQESAKSNMACKNIVAPAVVPNPPSNLTVAQDTPIAYTIFTTTGKILVTAVGTAKPMATCGPQMLRPFNKTEVLYNVDVTNVDLLPGVNPDVVFTSCVS